jgi:hypothetical protein
MILDTACLRAYRKLACISEQRSTHSRNWNNEKSVSEFESTLGRNNDAAACERGFIERCTPLL